MKQGYEVDGKVATNLKDLAELLGADKVTRKDIIGDGKYASQVNLLDLVDDDSEDTPAAPPADNPDTDGDESAPLEAAGEGEQGKTSPESIMTTEEFEAGYPVKAPAEDASEGEEIGDPIETVPDSEITMTPDEARQAFPEFQSLDELKEFIKDMDTPTLEYMAKSLGCEWNPTYHAAIHRMRVAQSLHHFYFPELFTPKEDKKKKKAKYGDYTTDQLFKMARENHVKVVKSNNEPIDRMRVIMALKEAGHLPA